MNKIIYLICLIILSVSCFNDDTKFGNTKLSEITVKEGIADTYLKEKQEVLTIEPTVEQSIAGQELKYEWFVDYVSVSKEKNLSYTCTKLGEIPCHLKVSNEDNVFFYDFKLNVISPYEQGLLVLSTANDKSMLSFKRRDKEGAEFVKNVFKLNNPEYSLGKEALTMGWVDEKSIYISTKTPSKIVSIDPKTFEILNEVKNPDEPMEIHTITNMYPMVTATMVGKGKVYLYMARDDLFFTEPSDGLPENAYLSDKSFFVAKPSGGWANGMVFYDVTNKKLMWFGGAFKYVDLENASFPDHEMVDMMACDKQVNALLVMKDADDNLSVVRLSLNEDKILDDIPVVGETFKENSIRIVHPDKTIMYYTDGNKLYAHNYLTNNFPSNPFITITDGNITKTLLTPEGDKLFVAYNSGSGDLTGCVNCYDANSGDLIWEEKNIAGNIVDLLYR